MTEHLPMMYTCPIKFCCTFLYGDKFPSECIRLKCEQLQHPLTTEDRHEAHCVFCGRSITIPKTEDIFDDEHAAWANGLCVSCYRRSQDEEWN